MSEWLTYSLSDFLLFSPRTYYRLFELYNRAVWPGQVIALGLGLAIPAMLRRKDRAQGRTIAGILAACWLWVAWAYLLQRYDTIIWTAKYFAAAFAAQALLLLWTGSLRGRLLFRVDRDPIAWAGLGLFLFALLLQPLLGPLLDRPWTQAEIFGLAPDPTAVATLGLLLLAAGRVRWKLLALPLVWCVVTGLTLWAMGSPDALIPPAAALLTLALTAWRARSATSPLAEGAAG